jgi:hypothetical protein
LLRLRARLRGRALDARLLAGARPEESRVLMARSAIVVGPENRAEVARALREMLDAAEHARRIFMQAQLRLREFQLVQARSEIRALADTLEGDEPVDARGVILADRLVRDGDSPVFWPSEDSIDAAVKEARDALELR